MITLSQPWHKAHHGEKWADDSYIKRYLSAYWSWLTTTVIPSPPALPLTYHGMTFKPGYFERLLERSQQLPDSLGEVKRAEARRLANELWLWRQWWLEKT